MPRRTQTSIRLSPGRIQVRGPLASLILDGLMDQGLSEAERQRKRNEALQNQPGNANAPSGEPSTTCWGPNRPSKPGYYWAKLGPNNKALGVVGVSGAEVRFWYNGTSVLVTNKRFLAWCGPVREPLEA